MVQESHPVLLTLLQPISLLGFLQEERCKIISSPTNTKGCHFSHVTILSLGGLGTNVSPPRTQAASEGNHIPLSCLLLCIKSLLHFHSSGLIN